MCLTEGSALGSLCGEQCASMQEHVYNLKCLLLGLRCDATSAATAGEKSRILQDQ